VPALSWPFEPVVIVGVVLAGAMYVLGSVGLRPDRLRATAFWGALAVILIALQSPLEMLARQLFWVHMVQHLLLMVVVAPLLAVASPWTRLWRALPRSWRRAIARPLFRGRLRAPLRTLYRAVAQPAVIWVAAAVNLWLWHLPQLYDLTLRNHAVHHLEHVLFLGTSIAFWAFVIDQHPFRSRLGSLARAAFVFTALVQSWALAAVLSFATAPLYAYALEPSRPGGISALTDQQIGGGMMWVPGAIPSSVVFVWLLFRWLADESRLEPVGGAVGD
jgi:cytochrome c oxidase assembly factor CtaG